MSSIQLIIPAATSFWSYITSKRRIDEQIRSDDMAPTPTTDKAPTATDSDGRATKKLRVSVDDSASFLSPQLTIIVGNEANKTAKTFFAHQDFLTRYSDFFAAAVRNGWRESQERIVRLPEQQAEIFELFIKFIYTGKMCSSKEGDSYTDPSGTTHNNEYERLADAWKLGSTLLSASFQDAATDALVHVIMKDKTYPSGLHNVLYGKSITPNGFSRLLVDIAIWRWPNSGWDVASKSTRTPKEFWHDIAMRQRSLLGGNKGTPPWEKEDCFYHEHVKTGAACYKTLF